MMPICAMTRSVSSVTLMARGSSLVPALRSTSITCTPWSASRLAAARPMGPAPITRTSVSICHAEFRS